MSKLVGDIIVVVVLTFPIWLTGIMIVLQNAKGAIIEKRGNWRLKEGEKVLCSGTKYVVVEQQYRKQRRVFGIWWTVKWVKLCNYKWMKANGFEVI